jgi:hypothetical protein
VLIPYNYNLRAREFHHTATAARTTAKPASIWTPLTKHSLSSELISRTQPSASQVRERCSFFDVLSRARLRRRQIYYIFNFQPRLAQISIFNLVGSLHFNGFALELGEIRFHACILVRARAARVPFSPMEKSLRATRVLFTRGALSFPQKSPH